MNGTLIPMWHNGLAGEFTGIRDKGVPRGPLMGDLEGYPPYTPYIFYTLLER